MTINDTAEAAHRVASAAMYGGAGISASSGVSMYFGLSVEQWQVFGVLGGLVFAAAGFLTNLYFKHAHLQLAKAKLSEPEA